MGGGRETVVKKERQKTNETKRDCLPLLHVYVYHMIVKYEYWSTSRDNFRNEKRTHQRSPKITTRSRDFRRGGGQPQKSQELIYNSLQFSDNGKHQIVHYLIVFVLLQELFRSVSINAVSSAPGSATSSTPSGTIHSVLVVRVSGAGTRRASRRLLWSISFTVDCLRALSVSCCSWRHFYDLVLVRTCR